MRRGDRVLFAHGVVHIVEHVASRAMTYCGSVTYEREIVPDVPTCLWCVARWLNNVYDDASRRSERWTKMTDNL